MTINTDHRPRRDLDDTQARRPAPGAPAPAEPPAGQFAKTPPHDEEAEQVVLGAMLLSKDAIGDVIDILAGRDFYRPVHGTIFDAILDLYGRGKPTDPQAVANRLYITRDLNRVGGAPYLHTLIEAVPTVANATWHAGTVKEFAEQRRLIEIGTRVTQIGYQGRLDPDDDPIDRAGQLFFDAVGDTDTGVTSTVDLVRATLDQIDAAGKGTDPGLSTGLPDLDDLLNGGLRGGQFVIIAGRPGMGKSVLTMDIARHNALHHGKHVAVFNLEMTGPEILMRVISAETGVFFTRLRRGDVAHEDWITINRKSSDISESGLHIDDFANQTLTSIRARARRLKQRGKLDLIVVDYLQLLSTGKRAESRQQEIAEISRGLKLLAKELDVPVVACSQLNRGNEQRSDKRPQLSDLRESGAQEQDADIVILMHRPDYHDKECERAGEADLIVAKHRGGATDTVTVAAQLHLMRFASMALA
ncbi:replicative DNA helicase [Micromonospora chersina]|uniref:replicative DNA helicase n=1 Tax=Micromonospora chersina TaxID=47854 RepID=UPI003715C452